MGCCQGGNNVLPYCSVLLRTPWYSFVLLGTPSYSFVLLRTPSYSKMTSGVYNKKKSMYFCTPWYSSALPGISTYAQALLAIPLQFSIYKGVFNIQIISESHVLREDDSRGRSYCVRQDIDDRLSKLFRQHRNSACLWFKIGLISDWLIINRPL